MDILILILKGVMLFVAVIMTFFILLQEGKGGGLAALGGTKGASIEGVTNPIRRATAYLAALFLILTVLIGFLSKGGNTLVKGGLSEDKPAMSPGAEKSGEGDGMGSPAIKPDAEHVAPEAPVPGAKKTEETPEPAKSGEAKTGETKSGETKTGEAKTEEAKTGEAAPAEAKTGEAKTAEEKTAAPEVKTPVKAEEPKAEAPAKTGEAKTEPAKTEAAKTE